MVADNKEAIVPPIKARMPNSDKVLRCPGAKEPMPPICMPIEAKFAKPQSIYVAMIIDFSNFKWVALATFFKPDN